MKGRYKVILGVVQEHEYCVDEANSPEEAIDIAERYLDQGEEGTVTSTEIVNWDAYPEEEGEERANK